MKVLWGILISVFMTAASVAANKYDDRRMKAAYKQKKKIEKRRKELVARNVKSHEIVIYRREKLRVPKKVQEHVMEYKRKSKTEDKKTARKVKRTYKRHDRGNDQIVRANKNNYSTKYSQKQSETGSSPDNSTEGTFVQKRHVKNKNRGNTTFNNPEEVVRY
jgi:hypothetical protein